jgi:phospholipid/cholesterol/gamma-HCH transport system permease protein
MTATTHRPQYRIDTSQPACARLSGDWSLAHAMDIPARLHELPDSVESLDARDIGLIDSAGVMQLLRYAASRHWSPQQLHFRDEHRALVDIIQDVSDARPKPARDFGFVAALARLGMRVSDEAGRIVGLLGFTGESLLKLWRLLRQPRRIRPVSIVYHMEHVGLDAVPLVALLSYLVGTVIAFLGSTVLRDFGAEIYVVELVSIAFLREFAVLLTAIVLAGRTASAFTAQIGSMKANQEIDALYTLGLDPVDVLVLPRLIALLVTLPLLTFVAMLAGLAGGVTVGAFSLDISPQQYLIRMHDTLQVRHFLIGLSKAPIFAMVIGLIGCLEGLRVKGTAQSVGERTTSSVVQAISLVIVLDALAALWFMEMGW